MKPLTLFRIFGLEIRIAVPLFFVASLVWWLIWAIVGAVLIDAPAPQVILFGFCAMLLLWVNEVLHNIGHQIAARRTGYPMSHIFLWALATSGYPEDEGELPPDVHIQRALGGPLFSTLVGVLALLLVLVIPPESGLPFWLLVYVAATNLTVFGPGALMPIARGDFMSDGATIRHWRKQKAAR